MIFENVELHNVIETERMDGVPGVLLRRFPIALRNQLNDRARFVARSGTGCEVRFVTDAPVVRVTLFSLDGDGDIYVYSGDFLHGVQKIPQGGIRSIQMERSTRFDNMKPEAAKRNFSPRCWRFIVNRAEVAFVSVDTFGHPVRPPNADEKPRRRWIAHGSSITHSHCDHGYPAVAGKLLGVDVLNLGLSGACHCEPEMADFLASRSDWDLLTAELGINMRGHIPVEEFRRRATYLIDTLVAAHPTKPIALINHYPTNASHPTDPAETYATREREYDQTLRDLVAAKKHPKLHLIEGNTILERFDTLSIDMVHPTAVGQALMGVNLARKLAEIAL